MGTENPTGPTVLVVEDDADIRELLTRFLQANGYTAVPAADGSEALAHLRRGPPPGLILLDLDMPVVDGWHFIQQVRRSLPGFAVPIVVTTGIGFVNREWALAHSCAGCINKPIDLDELRALVRRLCPG